jgi:hypothetical protein
LESPDGSKEVKIDVYEAFRMLQNLEKLPSEDAKWKKILEWLSKKLDIPEEDLAENMAIAFQNAIIELVEKSSDKLSKQFFSTVSWDDSTQAFQETI